MLTAVAQAEVRRRGHISSSSCRLLVGSPLRNFLDRILVVDCAEETQVQRLMARDAETEQQARRYPRRPGQP